MKFFLFDSLSRKKKEFVPHNPNEIKIYACGPTVYDYPHIGNARMAVATDLLSKVLKSIYVNVNFVSNITDIDDKIIKVSNEKNVSIKDITNKFTKIYNQDMTSLGVTAPSKQPKATDHIDDMIEMINLLLKNKCAYLSDNHVLFNVKKYKFYGSLSRRSREEQIAGSRVEIADYKKNAEDFILWKPSDSQEPGWDSPWGRGRPGWHIECSAMSKKCLGLPFDIHCGGVDLTFPHHENEIAQSCSSISINAEPTEFCKYWFHNGFVTVNGEKMSKSLGNITLVNEVLKKYDGSTVRYSLLTSQYRQPLDWSEKILEQSKKTLLRFRRLMNNFEHCEDENNYQEESYNDFLEALYDDLNTPRAFAVLNKCFEKLKKSQGEEAKKNLSTISKSFKLVGINLRKTNPIHENLNEDEKSQIMRLILDREAAREKKDFDQADSIRKKLNDLKIEIEDTPNGTLWKKSE